MKPTVLRTLILLALSLTIVPHALAADAGKIKREREWLGMAKEQAKDICRNSRLSSAEKMKMLCDQYGICSPGSGSCLFTVNDWYKDSLSQLRRNPDQYFYNVERTRRR